MFLPQNRLILKFSNLSVLHKGLLTQDWVFRLGLQLQNPILHCAQNRGLRDSVRFGASKMTLSIHRALILLSSCSWLPWRFKEWVMRKCQYRLINPLSFNSSRDRAKWFEVLHLSFFASQNTKSFCQWQKSKREESSIEKGKNINDLPDLNWNPDLGKSCVQFFGLFFVKISFYLEKDYFEMKLTAVYMYAMWFQ